MFDDVKCHDSRCFACENGFCQILKDNDFKGKKCPFRKTRTQIKNFYKQHPELENTEWA